MSLTKVPYSMIDGVPINIVDFGADPTGVSDSSAAIQAAINYALANDMTVVGSGTYRISQKIVIKCDADFGNATFNVYDTPEWAVEVSTGNATNPTQNLFNLVVYLPNVINKTKPAVGWAGQKYGVRTVNTNNCNVYVRNINGFATNFMVTSYGGNGNAYNNYFIQFLENGEINLNIQPGDSASWTNENNFFGGRFNQNSDEGTALPGCCQIYMPAVPVGWVGSQNNNVFYKPSLEGDAPQYHVVNGGGNNMFISARWETYVNPPKVLYIGNSPGQGSYNTIFYGYSSEAIEFTYSGTAPIFNQYYSNKKLALNFDAVEGVRMQNQVSSDNGIIAFYEAGVKTDTAPNNTWTMLNTARYLRGKLDTDPVSRIILDYTGGTLNFGDGVSLTLGTIGGNSNYVFVKTTNGFIPFSDNTMTCGSSSNRWSVVYAATGTINTSDARNKQQVRTLSDAEKAVAVKCKGLVRAFKFNDAVEKKGDAARIHFGVIAQDVMAAFESEGLDATKYGLLCYDEWGAEEAQRNADGVVSKPAREAGNRYGVRYEELLAFIISAL